MEPPPCIAPSPETTSDSSAGSWTTPRSTSTRRIQSRDGQLCIGMTPLLHASAIGSDDRADSKNFFFVVLYSFATSCRALYLGHLRIALALLQHKDINIALEVYVVSILTGY